MVSLGFEPRQQDGRRRRNHGAMAAAQVREYFVRQRINAAVTLQIRYFGTRLIGGVGSNPTSVTIAGDQVRGQ